jgi:hypothetical protein
VEDNIFLTDRFTFALLSSVLSIQFLFFCFLQFFVVPYLYISNTNTISLKKKKKKIITHPFSFSKKKSFRNFNTHSVRANTNTTKRSKKNLQYPFRFSTKNLYKTTQIKTKIKKSSLKIIRTPKKKGFSTVWAPRKCRNSKLFALIGVGL